MEIDKIREHTCYQTKDPMSPKKCGCRKFITLEEARVKLALGLSQYIHVGRKPVDYEEACAHCTPAFRKSCLSCSGSGVIKLRRYEPILGNEIISSVVTRTVKVKKSPTIESKHILRGLEETEWGKQAHDRWDEYQLLTLRQRIRLLVKGNPSTEYFNAVFNEWIEGKINPMMGFPLPLRYEPDDDPKEGTGRRYDYGRSI
jgi:hypothetical protein